MHALSIKSQALSMATDSLYRNAHEVLPPSLNSTSPRPPLSDGTTRLYISYRSPFAQRAWITRNYKGLQDQIELVAIDLENKPVWYREVYSEEKVPALEHNSKVIVESLNIIKYIDNHFEGPSLFPDDTARREFGEEMISYSETFNEMVYNSFKGVTVREADPAFDVLEASFKKFDDGPFLLGQFSMVDIAYIPFVERAHIFLPEVWQYDISNGRPKLAAWIEEMNKIDAYKQTKSDPKEIITYYKKRFLAQQQ